MNSRQCKEHLDSLWWIKDPSSTIYAHGTFFSPQTLAYLLAEERISSPSPRFSLSSYLESFAYEGQYGVPLKQDSDHPEGETPININRHRFTKFNDEAGRFYESLNLFLDSLPFEYFTVPSLDDSSMENPNQCNATKSSTIVESSPSSPKILWRLPFPSKVPLDAIDIIEPVELPGCNGLFFPDINDTGRPYSVSENDVKRQIQKSLAFLLPELLYVRTINESKHEVRSRFKLIRQAVVSNDDDYSSDHHDTKGSMKDGWNDEFEYKKNPEEAILYFRDDAHPGIIIGPPIGGELLYDKESVQQLLNNEKPSLLPEEIKNEAFAKREQNFDMQEPLSTSSDFEDVGFPSLIKPLPILSTAIHNEKSLQQHVSTSRSNFLCSRSICNELSLLMKGSALSGNVTLLTATIFGIPYAFIVTGSNINKGTPCILNWSPFDVNQNSGNEQSHASPDPQTFIKPLPLPLKWNLPYNLTVTSLELPSLPFSLNSRCQISVLLDLLETDQVLRQTILLMAKVLIADAFKPSFPKLNAPNCPAASWKVDSNRLSSSSLPSFRAVAFFLTTHRLRFKQNPLLFSAACVLTQIANILQFYFSFNSKNSEQLSTPMIHSVSLTALVYDNLGPFLLHHFIICLRRFALALPATTREFKNIFFSDSDVLLETLSVLVHPFFLSEENLDTTSIKKVIVENMKAFQGSIGRGRQREQFAQMYFCRCQCAVLPTTFFYPYPLSSPSLPRESSILTLLEPWCLHSTSSLNSKNFEKDRTLEIAATNPTFRYFGLVRSERISKSNPSSSETSRSPMRRDHYKQKRRQDSFYSSESPLQSCQSKREIELENRHCTTYRPGTSKQRASKEYSNDCHRRRQQEKTHIKKEVSPTDTTLPRGQSCTKRLSPNLKTRKARHSSSSSLSSLRSSSSLSSLSSYSSFLKKRRSNHGKWKRVERKERNTKNGKSDLPDKPLFDKSRDWFKKQQNDQKKNQVQKQPLSSECPEENRNTVKHLGNGDWETIEQKKTHSWNPDEQNPPWSVLPNCEDEFQFDSPEGKTETESSDGEDRRNHDKQGPVGEKLNDGRPKFELLVMKVETWACKKFKLPRKEVVENGLHKLLERCQPDVNLFSYTVERLDRDPSGEHPTVIASGQPAMMRGPGPIKAGSLRSDTSHIQLIPTDRKPIRDAIILGLKNHEARNDNFKYEGWKSTKKMLKGGGMRSKGPSINKGTEDALELQPPVELGFEFTVDVWIRLPAAGQGPCRTLLSSGWECVFGITDDKWIGQRVKEDRNDYNRLIVPRVRSGEQMYTPQLILEHRGWHRLIFTHSVATMTRHYFLDGYRIGSCDVPNGLSTQIKFVGSLSSSIVSKQCFGAFSRLKLYDRVLADDEIAKSYGVSTLKTPSIDWNKTEKINAFQWVVQKDKYIKQTNRDR